MLSRNDCWSEEVDGVCCGATAVGKIHEGWICFVDMPLVHVELCFRHTLDACCDVVHDVLCVVACGDRAGDRDCEDVDFEFFDVCA